MRTLRYICTDVFDYSKTNESQFPTYFRADFKITYRMNFPKFICDFAIDFQNFTNRKNAYMIDYAITATSANEVLYYQQAFFPMFTLKITW